jgi:hypothetical protein
MFQVQRLPVKIVGGGCTGSLENRALKRAGVVFSRA